MVYRSFVLLCLLAVSPLDDYRKHFRAVLRQDAGHIGLGLFIVLLGCTAFSLSYLRRRGKDQAPIWFGIFALLYGARLLLDTDIVPFALSLPDRSAAFIRMLLTYLIAIPGLIFGYQLFPSWRPTLRWAVGFSIVFACAGIAADIVTGRPGTLHVANNVVVLLTWVIIGIVVFRQGRSLAALRPMRWGIAIFGMAVILGNLRGLGMLGLPFDPEPLGFACFLVALGRFLAVRTFENEDRLHALNKELEIATRIQSSILPHQMPECTGLKISAQYLPMTAVAGDFYDFLRIDDRRIGILIADVSGHGVPAALIASMVKIAIAAQLPHAGDPGLVLAGMNQTLCGKMQAQFVSAAYLFIDLDAALMRYAAAGHPPLLWWKANQERVESVEENGLLLGIVPRTTYTSVERAFERGDRFLMYTDGLMEAPNETDEFFGEERVRETLAQSRSLGPEECAGALIHRLRRFAGHDRGRTQDDDLTWIIIDVQAAESARGNPR